MGKFNKYTIIGFFIFFLTGLAIGWLIFNSPYKLVRVDKNDTQVNESVLWTCPNHPEIRETEPGKCPKCSSDLVKAVQNKDQEDPEEKIDTSGVVFTKQAVELTEVQTSVLTRKNPVKEIRLYGKVEISEGLKQKQLAYITGRIENLMITSTGEFVRKGQILASIFSPELASAQQSFLNAAQSKRSNPDAYNVAREKLRKMSLTDMQIGEIERRDRVKTSFDVRSTISGIVSFKYVNNGQYVAKGEKLYQVSDLSKVWVVFNAYESDLPFLNNGDKISFTLKPLPRTNFTGNISHIDPVIDPQSRVSKVRVEMDNESGLLKPDMFATGLVQANLSEYSDKLVIPELAVIWTGKRSLVYVKEVDTEEVVLFKPRMVKLGPLIGNGYIVINGLNEGEEIVTQGAYNIDAARKRKKN